MTCIYGRRSHSTGVCLRPAFFTLASRVNRYYAVVAATSMRFPDLIAARAKPRCRRRFSSFLPNPFICFGGFSDIVRKKTGQITGTGNALRSMREQGVSTSIYGGFVV